MFKKTNQKYCGTVSFAELASQNVVGYQNVDLISGEYNTGVSTFLQVGKEKTTQTLGAIAFDNASSMGSVLQLVAADGSTLTVDHDELGEVSAMFVYLNESDYADFGASSSGWYLLDDGEFLYPMNGYVLPYGTGFLVDCGDEASKIVYSGEVLKGTQSVALTGGEYNMTGNATPSEQTLGDFNLDNASSMGSVLMLVAPDGSTPNINHDELGEVSAMFIYLNESDYADFGASAPGWYLLDDGEFLYSMNSYPIPAGKGFLIDCGDEAAELVMPSVLAN